MAEEAAPAPEGGDESAAPKKKLSMVTVALALQTLLILGCGGLIAKIALKPKHVDLSQKTLQERAIASVRDDESKIQMLELEPLTIVLPQRHTLHTTIQVEVSDEETSLQVRRKKAAIRARILNVISLHTQKELEKIQGKLLIKDAIRDVINEEVIDAKKENPGVVRDIYFLEFMLI